MKREFEVIEKFKLYLDNTNIEFLVNKDFSIGESNFKIKNGRFILYIER